MMFLCYLETRGGIWFRRWSRRRRAGGRRGKDKRHTNREAFLFILVGMGCRLKRVAFSKPVLGVAFSIFIRKEG